MKCIDLDVLDTVVTDGLSASAILRCFFYDADGVLLLPPPGFGVTCLVLDGGRVELTVVVRSKS